MPTPSFRFIPLIVLLLGCLAPGAFAQSGPGMAEKQHVMAVASFRQARFSEAYGRFVELADAGHAPAATMALWMYANGPSLFGKDWDSSQDQLSAWAQLARQPAPVMVAVSYPKPAAASARQR
jgi:hypothetical protein